MIDSDEKVEQLIRDYFFQLTVGCDVIDCQEEECLSSPFFKHNFQTKTDAAVRAVELSLNHAFWPHLCNGPNYYMINPEIQNETKRFDSLVSKIINNSFPEVPEESSRRTVVSILTSGISISYILLSNSFHLSLTNMAIDDNLMREFPLVFQRAFNYFLPYESLFTQMVSEFIKNPNTLTFSHVRGLIMILMFDVFFNKSNFTSLLTPLIIHILNLPKKASLVFWTTLQYNPSLLRHILALCETQLSVFVLKQPVTTFQRNSVFAICHFITLLQKTSDISLAPLKSPLFSNEALCRRLDPLKELRRLENRRDSFLSYPSILSMKFKHKVLKSAQEDKQNQMAQMGMINGGLLMGRAITNNMLFNVLEIRRDHLVEDAIRKIPRIPNEDLMKKLVVTFKGEQGIDQGGVSREFFYLLINAVFSPDYGMFHTINGVYWFTVTPFEDYSTYAMLGTVVSLAMYNNVVLPIRFPTLLYKKILQQPIGLADLQEIDPNFVQSAHDMLQMRKRGEDVADLYLTFSTTVEQFGEKIEVPLIPNGTQIDVNNSNLDNYVSAYVNWWANTSIQAQYESFARGFTRISISRLFKIFAADELDILVSGEVVLDWAALKKNAKYIDGYNKDSQQIIWFWELFDTMDTEQKTQFLRFSTGSGRAPVGGLGDVALTIQKTSNIDMLPVSHTCFNMFSLPAYPTKAMLISKVLLAIEHTEGFGLV